jgi:DNA-binding phage protein
MLTPDEIREKLIGVNMSKIARETGLTRPTIYKFLTGEQNMQYDTVKRVSEYFEREG